MNILRCQRWWVTSVCMWSPVNSLILRFWCCLVKMEQAKRHSSECWLETWNQMRVCLFQVNVLPLLSIGTLKVRKKPVDRSDSRPLIVAFREQPQLWTATGWWWYDERLSRLFIIIDYKSSIQSAYEPHYFISQATGNTDLKCQSCQFMWKCQMAALSQKSVCCEKNTDNSSFLWIYSCNSRNYWSVLRVHLKS